MLYINFHCVFRNTNIINLTKREACLFCVRFCNTTEEFQFFDNYKLNTILMKIIYSISFLSYILKRRHSLKGKCLYIDNEPGVIGKT